MQWRPRLTVPFRLRHCDLLDDHIFFGHVLMSSGASGCYLPDLVDHVHAFGNFGEYAITPAVTTRGFEVKKAVVDHIYKELSRCGVRIAGARHSQRAPVVFQAVIRLIFNRFIGRFLNHSRFKSATLDHEPFYDPVKNRVVVEAGTTISQKIINRCRRFLIESLNNDITVICVQSDHDRPLRREK
jgi:hypothetical protein